MNTENKSHLDYPLSNIEWVMNKVDDTLCSYLANRLDIRIRDERVIELILGTMWYY